LTALAAVSSTRFTRPPKNVEETRQYILDFIRLNDAAKTARELYDQMLELYPDPANPGSLWSSAAAAKAET